MNLFQNMGAMLRRFSVLLIILLLALLFLALYYFKYIPDNRERLQRQGFLILQQQSRGIVQSVIDHNLFFKAKKDDDLARNSMRVGSRKDTTGPFPYSEWRVDDNTLPDTPSMQVYEKLGNFHPDPDLGLLFSFGGGFTFSINVEEIIGKTLDQDRVDFFENYFALHQCARSDANPRDTGVSMLYHSEDLFISDRIPTDSIGKLFKGLQFSKILDLPVNGNPYKVFLLPFQLGKHTIILAGLVPEKKYISRLQNIPFLATDIILNLFIFLLISLPFVKIFLLSSEEHIGVKDIAILGVSLFVGMAVLAIMWQHLVMQTGADRRTREELYNISEKIHSSFQKELSDVTEGIRDADRALLGYALSGLPVNDKNKISICVINKVRNCDSLQIPASKLISRNLDFTVLHWSSDTGMQVFKSKLTETPLPFLDLSERNYFKDFKAGRTNTLEGPNPTPFVIEPVHSMSTGKFEVNIGIPSIIPPKRMASMSLSMRSLMNTILPSGYGFYVLDKQGKILFRSDGIVTLKENFLEWLGGGQQLNRTIVNRHSQYIPIQFIFDKQYSLFARPMDNLSWSLIVYHCIEPSTASDLRVSSFTFYCVLILQSMLFLYALVGWNRFNFISRLRQPANQFKWLKPGADKLDFINKANRYIILNLLGSILFSWVFDFSPYIWFVGLIGPIITVWNLYLTYKRCLLVKEKSSYEKIKSIVKREPQSQKEDQRGKMPAAFYLYNLIPFFFLVILDIFIFKITDFGKLVSIVLFELCSLLVIPLLAEFIGAMLEKTKIEKWIDRQEIYKTSANRYYLFVLLLVAAISILPATLFYVFAQKREQVLITKTSQLGIARKIDSRMAEYRKLPFMEIYCPLAFEYGIYSPDDSLKIEPIIKHFESPLNIYTEPYDTIVSVSGWNYHSLDSPLAIQNRAIDGHWSWKHLWRRGAPRDTLKYNLSPENLPFDPAYQNHSLVISSIIPGIWKYYRMNSWEWLFLVVVFSLGLLAGLYYLIKAMCRRLFLIGLYPDWEIFAYSKDNLIIKKTSIGYLRRENLESIVKYHKEKQEKDSAEKKSVDKEFTSKDEATSKVGDTIKQESNEQLAHDLYRIWKDEYKFTGVEEDEVVKAEENILYNQYHFKDFYDMLWDDLSPNEQYFLYDMALDGFINWKNAGMIQGLLYKGILVYYHQDDLRIMSVSFRNYLLGKKRTKEIEKLERQFKVQGTWNRFRTPVLIAITSIGIFLFITQEDLMQRVGAIIPTLTAILGLGTFIAGSKSAPAEK
ncbi:MAG: hypothetical protein C5B52_08465 [Bacteroidetes bacterium]|nr:MAG: hypothetical protein C5B52_08465 [Bacteroidota bacterium]